jgi:hypothetical protein
MICAARQLNTGLQSALSKDIHGVAKLMAIWHG